MVLKWQKTGTQSLFNLNHNLQTLREFTNGYCVLYGACRGLHWVIEAKPFRYQRHQNLLYQTMPECRLWLFCLAPLLHHHYVHSCIFETLGWVSFPRNCGLSILPGLRLLHQQHIGKRKTKETKQNHKLLTPTWRLKKGDNTLTTCRWMLKATTEGLCTH